MSEYDEDIINADPFDLFSDWFDDAKKTEINDPDAIALATVNKNGMPSVRMVLLKEFSREGFVFYTNYNSRKSLELFETKKASFVIHWKSLRRQVRVIGNINKVSTTQTQNYFSTRGRGSQLGAWASKQSQILDSRQTLIDETRKIQKKFPDEVPSPPHWGGFKIKPIEIEFWIDGEHRLHNRFQFKLVNNVNWICNRLYP